MSSKIHGADAVKFQTIGPKISSPIKSLSISYENNGQAIAESQYDLFKRCELSFEQLKELKAYCDSVNISFHSTPYQRIGIE
ncbi:MAG: N-acetylneuraminate synthase family protein [Candidatus Obscuribacter sp.]|nr:N-acetylneuraminate synthase family protein [Candidatus Obscuribacter sp.]